MEQGQEARAPEREEVWEGRKGEAKDVAEALAQVPVGTVFARSVGKEPLINWENPALSRNVLNVERLRHEGSDRCIRGGDLTAPQYWKN